MSKNPTHKVYFHKGQIDVMKATQDIVVAVCGRSWGKGACIGLCTYMRSQDMPRAKGFITTTTYSQLRKKTLPVIVKTWEALGLVRGVDFVIGKRPPKWFHLPYEMPEDHKYFIFFQTGFCIELISLDRPDNERGGSYQVGWVDEAALVKEEYFTKVLIPSMRGLRHKFVNHLHYGQISLFTTIPWKPSGFWILEYEEKAKVKPDQYYWREGSSWENKAVIGTKQLLMWKETMGFLEYEVEVMNRRVKKAQEPFYHTFNEEKHCYTPSAIYNKTTGKRTFSDVDSKKLLEASFDFSGWFNCCTVWQESNRTERMVNYLFVKQDEKVNELVDKFCETYSEHQFKFVRIWGEPRGHDRRPDGPDIYTQIQRRFEGKGWRCEIKAHAGRTTNHKTRHTIINNCFQEIDKRHPKIQVNSETCKDAIFSLQITEVKPDYSKDKSVERDRNFPQEHAPHVTDTVDYYIVQKYGKSIKGGKRRGQMWM